MHKINRLTVVKLASDYCWTFVWLLSDEKESTVRRL